VWAVVFAAGAALLLAFLDQRGAIDAARWLGPQVAAGLSRVPPLDLVVWALAAAAYVRLVSILWHLRRRLRQGDRGTHERVATV
jgi:hypothetical protein